jgi:hypothetical protein
VATQPVVSVIMPVRDGARFLDEAVRSVTSQTLEDLELVVVDDGSIDDTPGLLSAWQDRDPRVRVMRRPTAGGYTTALTQGISQAKGDLLARLDADDRAWRDRLRLQAETFRARPGLGLLGTGVRYIDERGRTLKVESQESGPAVARMLGAGQNPFFHPSVMMSRSAYEAAGGYRSQMEPSEDFDLWLRIGEKFEVDILGDPLIDYRLHPGQVTVVQLKRAATTAAAARWAAAVRASGLPDPVEELEDVTEAALLDIGMNADELRRQRAEVYQWATELYSETGFPEIAAACWDAARAEARGSSRAEKGAWFLMRARMRREHGQWAPWLLDLVRAATFDPRLLAAAIRRRARSHRRHRR